MIPSAMKTAISTIAALVLFTACKTIQPLYYWGDYEYHSYNVVNGNKDKDIQKLMGCYDDILMNGANGTRTSPPPGICADYGFFLMQEGKLDEGKLWLQKEKTFYPESTVFIDSILKTTEK